MFLRSHGPRLAGLLLMLSGAAVAAAAPQVTIDQGRLKGVQEEGIAVFRGIPFAGDTGGDNRWRPPTPAPHWEGVREARDAGPICPQSSAARNGVVAPWLAHFTMSEDCLNLAVYSPDLKPKQKAPVMVWIHGGLARIGTGSRHDGKNLAHEGVVVVTINYRLDRLGQFAHPAISAEQPDAMLANYGLMDMQAALRWVQTNIAHFGGDPDNVTIFGHSSGGVAVTALMGSPLSEGLFHRAISQSGSMTDIDHERRLSQDLPGSPSQEADGRRMVTALLPDADAVTPQALRALSWQQIIGYTETQAATALMPVIDGKVLPESVTQRFIDGRQVPVPFMIGANSWEQSLFVHFNLPLKPILAGVPEAEVRAVYPGLDDKALVGAWLADTGFHAPDRFLASGSARSGHPTWVYRFDHIPAAHPDQPGAAHGDAVDYLFDPVALPKWSRDDADERAIAATLRGYWVNFARTGDPNGAGLPHWPQWNARSAQTQILDVPAHPQAEVWKQRMDYHMQRYAKKLEAASAR